MLGCWHNMSLSCSARAERSPSDSQVPRPAVAQGSEEVREVRTRALSTTAPPPAASNFRVIDDGNCSPRFMRMTMNQIPTTREIATRMAIPMACVMQPLAELPQAEGAVPFVSDMQQGPVRCRRCRGYINCHVAFVDGGRHWGCNLCGMMNAVEPDYFCTLDHTAPARPPAPGLVARMHRRSPRHTMSRTYASRPSLRIYIPRASACPMPPSHTLRAGR